MQISRRSRKILDKLTAQAEKLYNDIAEFQSDLQDEYEHSNSPNANKLIQRLGDVLTHAYGTLDDLTTITEE